MRLGFKFRQPLYNWSLPYVERYGITLEADSDNVCCIANCV